MLPCRCVNFLFGLWGPVVLAVAVAFRPSQLVQNNRPVLRLEATITRIDRLPAYVLIKATSTADQQPLTILSRRGEADSSLTSYASRARVHKGQKYTFRLQATSEFKLSAPGEPPEYFLLNCFAFSVGNKQVYDGEKFPYIALNMQDSFLYQ